MTHTTRVELVITFATLETDRPPLLSSILMSTFWKAFKVSYFVLAHSDVHHLVITGFLIDLPFLRLALRNLYLLDTNVENLSVKFEKPLNNIGAVLSPILPNVSFWSPWKHPKTFSLLLFLGGSKGNIGKKRVNKKI